MEDRQLLIRISKYLNKEIARVEHERKTFMPMATDIGKEQMAKDLLNLIERNVNA